MTYAFMSKLFVHMLAQTRHTQERERCLFNQNGEHISSYRPDDRN